MAKNNWKQQNRAWQEHRRDWEFISSNLRGSISVINYAHPNCRTDHDMRLGTRVFFVCKGSGVLRNPASGKCLQMRPNQAYLIPPKLAVEADYPPDLYLWALEFQLQLIPGLDLFGAIPDILEFTPEAAVYRKFQELYFAPPSWNNFFGFEELRMHVINAVLSIAEPGIIYQEFFSNAVKYANLLSFLQTGATAKTSMAELAAAESCTYDKLSRQVQKDLHLTLKAMLDAELSMQAKVMLNTTCFSIKEIAEKLGFSNAYNFSRFFTRMNRLPPNAYRSRISFFCKPDADRSMRL